MESLVQSPNKQKRAAAANLLCGKRSSASKQANEGVGIFFCGVGSVDLALNRQKWAPAASTAVRKA